MKAASLVTLAVALISGTALAQVFVSVSFHLIKRPKSEARVRIAEGQTVRAA